MIEFKYIIYDINNRFSCYTYIFLLHIAKNVLFIYCHLFDVMYDKEISAVVHEEDLIHQGFADDLDEIQKAWPDTCQVLQHSHPVINNFKLHVMFSNRNS